MAASKNSKILRLSSGFVSTTLCFLASAAVMACAVWYFYRIGSTLDYGDAEAHLNIARRILDSRTPGWYQVGTTWLPLPHLLMIPLVRNDWYWKTGLAGAITCGASMTLAATFFFAATRRVFSGVIAATAATAVVLLNPNVLYLGAIPMTEPIFFACLFALLYFTVRFLATQGWGALLGAAVAACAGTLTRYDGWVLLPFAALAILIGGPRKKWLKRCACAVVFCLIAGAGPLMWLAHNRYYFSDALYFYRGPYSALAIRGNVPYPGKGNWLVAAQYYLEAGHLVAGWPAMLVGTVGLILALAMLRRTIWPVLLLALPPVFYVCSVYSSGTPIFVPTLSPHSLYNTRYATALIPLIALGVGAIARMNRWAGLAAVAIVFAPLAIHPADRSITRQEAEINSRARRQWTARTAKYLSAVVEPHDTFITYFGDMTGIYRTMGLPLRATLTGNNDLEWAEATTRPDLFLHADWAVVMGGDTVQTMIDRMRLHGPRYDLEQRIMVRGAPVIEIYHRVYDSPVY